MSMRILLIVAGVMCAACWAIALDGDQDGLVAHWTFDEGKGTVARDASGNGNHAQIHGAAFVEFDKGFALQFDGKDDYVDCGKPPSLNIEKAGTIVLWFKPQAVQGGLFSRSSGGGWADERFVLSFKDYGGERAFLYCVGDGKTYSYAHMPLPRMNAWSQAAVVVSGRRISVFRDGILVRANVVGFAPKFADFPLLLGKSQGLGPPFLKGLIDDARVYNRALPQSEIISLCKAQAAARGLGTDPFEKPRLNVAAYPLSGRLVVGIDYQLMWPVPEGTSFEVTVKRPGSTRPVSRTRVPASPTRCSIEAILDLQNEPAGALQVQVQALLTTGKRLGKTAGTIVNWPERDPMFSPKKGIKVLNGFVFELLNVKSPGSKEFTFHNPREGWVYIASTLQAVSGLQPTVALDSQKVPLRLVSGQFEAMRHVSEGPHKIRVILGAPSSRLTVRAIPELFYDMYGVNPLVPETGNYTWQWLRKHVLDHYNCITGTQSPEKHENEIKDWTSEGKRWHTQRSLPWVKTVEEAYKYWSTETGMTHPLMSGIWADEFSGGEKYKKMYPIWCEALRRIKANPKFKDRQFYAYMGMTYTPGYDLLTKTAMECNLRLAPEWYLREQPTEQQALSYMSASYERNNRDKYEAAYPGAALNRVVVLGLLSQPEESCDIHPDVNYNVFLDLQLHFMANDPAFFGTRGLQGYYSPYVGEEQTRVFARLVRHYAIEGRTDRFFKDPYEMTHLKNPDFTEGTTGWTLSPAAQGTMAPKTVERFGFLQGRYDRSGIGDTVIWTKRGADKPNVFAQEIGDLEPGRLYSLRFFTGNYQDYLKGKSRSYKHGVAVTIENVDLIPDKAFQALIKSCYAHRYEKFDRNNPYRMNYHQRIFRAKGKTARLALSDWVSGTQPGGPAGEELIWNFIQVQPYFKEEH